MKTKDMNKVQNEKVITIQIIRVDLPIDCRLCSGALPNCAGVGARTNTLSFSLSHCFDVDATSDEPDIGDDSISCW